MTRTRDEYTHCMNKIIIKNRKKKAKASIFLQILTYTIILSVPILIRGDYTSFLPPQDYFLSNNLLQFCFLQLQEFFFKKNRNYVMFSFIVNKLIFLCNYNQSILFFYRAERNRAVYWHLCFSRRIKSKFIDMMPATFHEKTRMFIDISFSQEVTSVLSIFITLWHNLTTKYVLGNRRIFFLINPFYFYNFWNLEWMI